MMKPIPSLAAALAAVLLSSCAPTPAKKDGGSLINVTTGSGGKEGGAAGTGGPAGTGAGTAGTSVDPTGAAGDSPAPDAAIDLGTVGEAGTGAAGTGPAGTGAAGAGAAGTGAAGSAAVDAGAADTRTASDARDASAGDRTAADAVVTPLDPCNRATWTVTANFACTAPGCSLAATIDGDPATRYTTGFAQGSRGPESVTLTFRAPVTVGGVRILSKGGDGPSLYRVDWSTDATTFWNFEPPVTGAGTDEVTATFPAPKAVIALRVNQLGLKPTNWWSVHELALVGCAH